MSGSSPAKPSAGLQFVDDVVVHALAGRRRLVGEVEGVAVEGRMRRRPAHPRGLRQGVGERLPAEQAPAERAGQFVRAEALVAPLVGVQVEERGAGHVPGGTLPVQTERHLHESGQRTHLLLTHVVRPAAAVHALAAAQHRQREERAVDLVGVEPVVGPGPHRDHRPALGQLGVARELPRHPGRRLRRHRGDHLLPCRRIGLHGVVVAGRPVAGQPVTTHRVLRHQQVEHRRDQPGTDPPDRHAAADHAAALGVSDVEARQVDGDGVLARVIEAQDRVDVSQLQVPLALAGLAEVRRESAVGKEGLTGGRIEQDGLVRRTAILQVRCGQEPVRHMRVPVAVFAQGHQERQIGVGLDVVGEVGHLPIPEELGEHDVAHRHRQCPVGAGVARQPVVGELGVVGIVGRDHDHLLSPVAGLGHEVRVRGPGDRQVGAPDDQVAGVPPVAGLGHVGLVAEHLRRRDRHVGVPVVEGQDGAADHRQEPGARRVRHL